MNTELAGAILSTAASDQIPLASYLCRVTVKKNDHGEEQTFAGEFEEIPTQQIGGPELTIKRGHRCRIEFVLETPGWKFLTIDPFSRNKVVGPFLWDLDEKSPAVQKDAGLEIPPHLRLEIDPEEQRWAKLEVINRHHHPKDAYRYSLLVVAWDGINRALPSPDPVLIEEPYEGPGDPPPPGS